MNRRGPPTKTPSPNSASKPTSDPAPRSNYSTALSQAVNALLDGMDSAAQREAPKAQALAKILSSVTLPEQQDDSTPSPDDDGTSENPSVQEQIEAMTPGQRRRLSGGSDF